MQAVVASVRHSSGSVGASQCEVHIYTSKDLPITCDDYTWLVQRCREVSIFLQAASNDGMDHEEVRELASAMHGEGKPMIRMLKRVMMFESATAPIRISAHTIKARSMWGRLVGLAAMGPAWNALACNGPCQ